MKTNISVYFTNGTLKLFDHVDADSIRIENGMLHFKINVFNLQRKIFHFGLPLTSINYYEIENIEGE